METVLVTGGAGYIGSHMVRFLTESGYRAVVLDNLSTGYRSAVQNAPFYEGDVRDSAVLDRVFENEPIGGVIHFAAFSLVEESVKNPVKYFQNNVGGAASLVQAMVKHNVPYLVLSSTAAVYGEPEKQPIEESDATHPANPYGESKLSIEKFLSWCTHAYGIRYAALRYFNAAGAWKNGELGEDHRPESHLIPLVLKTALGQRDHVGIFGTDYPTKDGTCIRDYISVCDLARAHLLAYEYLKRGGESDSFNLGSGCGYSVREVVKSAERITGKQIPIKSECRRAGDPSVLIASNEKARHVLGWKPEETLDSILESAWRWHSMHPNGYLGSEFER